MLDVDLKHGVATRSAEAEMLGGCVKVISYDCHGNVTAIITTESADSQADAQLMAGFLELERASRLRGAVFERYEMGGLTVIPRFVTSNYTLNS
ncbi:hypothetical protein [Cupriavidus gilardii]|uniref:hypothetical protein n=1 Tax=Cupriavidus gilardii TaxID=82541 RepID=UPI00158002FE|nr:hypothetical protein [Cupriavidus gilardii]QKS64732.1 hypothetical protein FOB47_23630 [Cupriavidus gilardii]